MAGMHHVRRGAALLAAVGLWLVPGTSAAVAGTPGTQDEPATPAPTRTPHPTSVFSGPHTGLLLLVIAAFVVPAVLVVIVAFTRKGPRAD